MKQNIIIRVTMICATSAVLFVLISCKTKPANSNLSNSTSQGSIVKLLGESFSVEVEPETFSLLIKDNKGNRAFASKSQTKALVSDVDSGKNFVSWTYTEKGIRVNLEFEDDYLNVDIFANDVTDFTWPKISDGADAYTIPWHSGKYIPVNDEHWLEFCKENGEFDGLQGLSMQFLGVNYQEFALVYIIKNPYNNKIHLSGEQSLSLNFLHEFPATVEDKQYGFRIYLTGNNPVEIAKTYKNYIVEKDQFVSITSKAIENPNVKKLFGAPHFYIWGDQFIVEQNISQWRQFTEKILAELASKGPTVSKHILNILANDEVGPSIKSILNKLQSQDYISDYQRKVIVLALNRAMMKQNFYDKVIMSEIKLDSEMKKLVLKGNDQLTKLEWFTLNKNLFYSYFQSYLQPMSQWGNGTSNSIIEGLQIRGINRAWLGLASFTPAYMHPEFLNAATEAGYLMGSYDSYHCIHEPENAQWETSDYSYDPTLYENVSVKNKNGEFIKGFLQIGRKINPTLAMPLVKYRMDDLFRNNFGFNSWFIDCDGTGEARDDYTQGRMTNQADDIEARIRRMEWIRDEKHLVIGSEGGNDFAAPTIAFAHGITTPVFVWGDEDWRVDQDSKYYFGQYYAPDGGVPIVFHKQVPIKELYHYIYMDCRYNVPLYQLVYNNSTIATHHWGFSSLKMIEEVKNNKLREVLYNFPPLYHIDRNWLEKNGETIAHHVKVWSKIHTKAIELEMTSFEWLSSNMMVQKTGFEDKLEIVANFDSIDFDYVSVTIPSMSLLIFDKENNKKEIYTPIQ